MFKGAIFDLDGVIVNTVPIHFKAWRKLFTKYGEKFTFQDYKTKVDGIPGLNGARAILAPFRGPVRVPRNKLPEKEVVKAANKKRKYFLEFLKKEKIPVFKSTVKLIKELRRKKIKIAAISSSKVAKHILKKTKLFNLFDTVVTGDEITKGKPDPQIFLLAAKRLKLKPKDCVVFEDALLGVEAAKKAKMFCLGIDHYNDPLRLKKAILIVKDLKEINYNKLKQLYNR